MKTYFRLVAVVILSLVLSEIGLRFSPQMPPYIEPVALNIKLPEQSPYMLAPRAYDPEIGWVNQPGEHEVKKPALSYHASVWSNGARKSRSGDPIEPQKHSLIIIGDSQSWGEGLADSETIAWQLQDHLPQQSVLNFASPGYGTCQAYLVLKRKFDQIALESPIVIYGLSSYHQERTVAAPSHVYDFAMASPAHSALYPRCRISERGELIISAPEIFENLFPCRKNFALCELGLRTWLYAGSLSIVKQKKAVVWELIKQINTLIRSRGGVFLILSQDLQESDRKELLPILSTTQIRFLDGQKFLDQSGSRLVDGHASFQTTKAWAELIEQTLLSMKL